MDVSLLQFRVSISKQREIVVEVVFPLLHVVSVVQGYSPVVSAKKPELPWTKVAKQELQELLVDDLKRKDASYVEETNTAIGRLPAWMTTMLRCIMEENKSEVHGLEAYDGTYRRIVRTGKNFLGIISQSWSMDFQKRATYKKIDWLKGEGWWLSWECWSPRLSYESYHLREKCSCQ